VLRLPHFREANKTFPSREAVAGGAVARPDTAVCRNQQPEIDVMKSSAFWDQEFLNERERSEREETQQGQTDSDWEAAIRQLAREAADGNRAYASCPAAKCRRARRCMSDSDACLKQLGIELPPEIEREQIEEIYAELQENRRIAAQEAGAE
jgi:hypothetical protein